MCNGDKWEGERFDFLKLPSSNILRLAAHRRYSVARRYLKGKVLEIGCGAGIGSVVLSECQLIGIDIDYRILPYAQQNYDMHSVSADARVLSFKSHIFDGVLCLEVLEHMAEHSQLLDEIARVLRTGGILVLSTPNSECLGIENYNVNKFHVLERSVFEIKDLLLRHFTVFRRFSCYLPIQCTKVGKTVIYRKFQRTFPRLTNYLLYWAGMLLPSKARFQVYVVERK